jgi:hypothetical protein
MIKVDDTEDLRRHRLAQLNGESRDKANLTAKHGKIWDHNEVRTEFVLKQFMAPYVVARRISDGQMGTLEFIHSPRFYFNWEADKKWTSENSHI